MREREGGERKERGDDLLFSCVKVASVHNDKVHTLEADKILTTETNEESEREREKERVRASFEEIPDARP